MNVDYAKFQKKFDSKTISRLITFKKKNAKVTFPLREVQVFGIGWKDSMYIFHRFKKTVYK